MKQIVSESLVPHLAPYSVFLKSPLFIFSHLKIEEKSYYFCSLSSLANKCFMQVALGLVIEAFYELHPLHAVRLRQTFHQSKSHGVNSDNLTVRGL
jgi:hypothetical protein